MINIGIDPVAFTIGSISVRWYGIMVALAIAVLVLWTMRAVRKGANISYDTVFTAALVGIPSGLVISRLLHVVDNIVVAKLHPELIGYVIDYTQYPELIIGAAGLSIWGGVLGTALGIGIYSKLTSSDYFCDPALIGQAVHPTQVYEIIYILIVFGVLLKLRGRLKPVGSLFILYLSLYSLWRIGIDFLRTGMPFLFGLHQAQVTALIVLAITIPLLALRTRWVKADDNTS